MLAGPMLTNSPLGRHHGQSRQEPRQVINLSRAFANAARTKDWLPAVIELAANALPMVGVEGRHSRCTSTTPRFEQPQRCPFHATLVAEASTSTALPPLHPLIVCVLGGHNNADAGRILPIEVWVLLGVIGYEPIQHGGL